MLLVELLATEGPEAAVTFDGADTVVELLLPLWLPALCCDDVRAGAVITCAAVGADTEVVRVPGVLDVPQVHPAFPDEDEVVICGAETTERFVGAERLVACVLLAPLPDCDATLGEVER
ncbi:MAG: hypothetical protein LC708_00730, partial [Actinobacteria bacterium]|nr:hypothetical protein [Actinomycetota bacterium]